MLKIVLIIAVIVVTLIVAFVVWRIAATIRATARRDQMLLEKLEPVAQALSSNHDPSPELVDKHAKDRLTRTTLYGLLEEYGRESLFPKAHFSAESFAESDMVRWLIHPNELDAVPDHIRLAERVEKDSETTIGMVEYYVFQFRTNPPHWAADNGWLAGVSGPFLKGKPPEIHRPGTFSRFEVYDSKSADEHAEYCHRSMLQRGYFKDLVDQEERPKND
jgi:hypothetical protein